MRRDSVEEALAIEVTEAPQAYLAIRCTGPRSYFRLVEQFDDQGNSRLYTLLTEAEALRLVSAIISHFKHRLNLEPVKSRSPSSHIPELPAE